MAKFIEDIRNNYRKLERELVTQLSYQVEHDVTTGTNREEILFQKNLTLHVRFLLLILIVNVQKK